MSRAIFTMLVLVLPATSAPVPKELKKEFKIEGTWRMVSCDCFGNPAGLRPDQHWTFDAEGKMVPHAGAVVPAGLTPAIQVVLDTMGVSKNAEFKYLTNEAPKPGLFEIGPDGETLKLCIDMRTAERPTKMEPGPNIYLWTLERAKPEAKK